MACIPRVHAEGVFRIKLKTKDLYLELDSDSGKLKLVPREEAADSQLWRIAPHEETSFKITNELNNRGLSYKAASIGGSGYPLIQNVKASPTYWILTEGTIGYQKYSKISPDGDSSGHVFDATKKKGLGASWVQLGPPRDGNENQQFEFEMGRSGYPPYLDILFLQDTTSSQGPYINAAVAGIGHICRRVSAFGQWKKEDVRMGIIAFRDHPPQDSSYVTYPYPFTNNIGIMESNLRQLQPQGGGDGPEAATAALDMALKADWRDDGAKIVVLITDAAPHGIGSSGDGFPAGDPDGRDPLQIARKMSRAAITLFVLACEPSLSGYLNALDFYRGLVSITGGTVVPLTNPDKLADLVITHAQEAIQVENLISMYGDDIAFQSRRPDFSVQRAAADLVDRLHRDGVCLEYVEEEDVYIESQVAEQNVEIWANAANLAEGRRKVTPIGGSRMKITPAVGVSTFQGTGSKPEPRPPTLSQAEKLVKQILKRNS